MPSGVWKNPSQPDMDHDGFFVVCGCSTQCADVSRFSSEKLIWGTQAQNNPDKIANRSTIYSRRFTPAAIFIPSQMPPFCSRYIIFLSDFIAVC